MPQEKLESKPVQSSPEYEDIEVIDETHEESDQENCDQEKSDQENSDYEKKLSKTLNTLQWTNWCHFDSEGHWRLYAKDMIFESSQKFYGKFVLN